VLQGIKDDDPNTVIAQTDEDAEGRVEEARQGIEGVQSKFFRWQEVQAC